MHHTMTRYLVDSVYCCYFFRTFARCFSCGCF